MISCGLLLPELLVRVPQGMAVEATRSHCGDHGTDSDNDNDSDGSSDIYGADGVGNVRAKRRRLTLPAQETCESPAGRTQHNIWTWYVAMTICVCRKGIW